jgi:tetratricopeptide (TPR) repeat protein
MKLLSLTSLWGPTAKRARVFGVSGWLNYINRNFASGRLLLGESLSIARTLDDKRQVAFALEWLGEISNRQRDDQTMQKYAEECFPLYEKLQDHRGMARAMSQLANVATNQGHYAEAEKLCNDCLARLREIGDGFGFREAYFLNGLGELARMRGDYEQAGKLYEENLEILGNLRSRTVMAASTYNLGWVSLQRGDFPKAKMFFEEGLNYYGEYDNKDAMTYCLSGFAALLGMIGKPNQAARLFSAMESSYEEIGDRVMDATDQKEIDFYLEVVRRQLDETSFAKAWAEGRAMTLKQAIAFASLET